MTTPDEPIGRLGRIPSPEHPGTTTHTIRPLLDARAAVVRKPTFWTLPSGPYPLDQGSEGACTGFGMAHELAAGPVFVLNVDHAYAMQRYRRNREEDREMGLDFPSGATSLGTMRAAKEDGLITGYRWAETVDDVVDTVCSVGPVCLGIDWSNSMYTTTRDGRVVVSGSWVGGHFIDILAYDEHPTWGPVVGWLNSWGEDYGVAEPRLNARGGIGWVTLSDLSRLLIDRRGEAAVPSDYFALPSAFVARRRSRVFHKVTCRLAPRTDRREFTTKDLALGAGLRGCWWCRP